MDKRKFEIIGFDLDVDCSRIINVDVDSLVYQINSKNQIKNKVYSEPYLNEYSVIYKNNSILEYQVEYYPSLYLKPNYNEGAEFDANISKFISFDYLIILIDGKYFQNESEKQIIKKLQRNCTRIINPYISAYAKKNQGCILPITFAVTKSNTFRDKFNNIAMVNIISEAFNSIFTDNVRKYVICLDEKNQKGINIPIMIGVDRAFITTKNSMKYSLDSDKRLLSAQINDQQGVINMHNNRFLKFLSKGEAKRAQVKINKLRAEITQKDEEYQRNAIWEQDKYFKSALARELKNNQNSLVYGFNNELQYEIIDSGKPKNDNCNEPVISMFGLIVFLIILSVIGIWLPALSCTVLAIIQLWYLIIECRFGRNLLTFATHIITYIMFATSGYSEILMDISIGLLCIGGICKAIKFFKGVNING